MDADESDQSDRRVHRLHPGADRRGQSVSAQAHAQLLVNVGIKNIDEVVDGLAGFEAIKNLDPDIVLLEWDLPMLNGPELVRIIRTPGMLPKAQLPIIMFGNIAKRSRIAEAKRLGVSTYLTMPISAKTLRDRILSLLAKPRAPAEAGEPEDMLLV